jgi:hypothetical protein
MANALTTDADRRAGLPPHTTINYSLPLFAASEEARDDKGRWTAAIGEALAETDRVNNLSKAVDTSKLDEKSQKQFATAVAKMAKAHDAGLEGRYGDALGYHLAVAKIFGKLGMKEQADAHTGAAKKHAVLPAYMQTAAGVKAEQVKENTANGLSAVAQEATKLAGGMDGPRVNALKYALATGDHEAAKDAHISLHDRHEALAVKSTGIAKRAHVAAAAANWDAALGHIIAAKKGLQLVEHHT